MKPTILQPSEIDEKASQSSYGGLVLLRMIKGRGIYGKKRLRKSVKLLIQIYNNLTRLLSL